MLQGAKNGSLYHEYYCIIQISEVKFAYSYIVGWASSLRGYECYPSSHGIIKDFRFMRGENWDFAFIPNQKWLLFYFRKPCQALAKYSRDAVFTCFPEASENNAGEYTLKISNLTSATNLASYIES
jgi:hypothetical protein